MAHKTLLTSVRLSRELAAQAPSVIHACASSRVPLE